MKQSITLQQYYQQMCLLWMGLCLLKYKKLYIITDAKSQSAKHIQPKHIALDPKELAQLKATPLGQIQLQAVNNLCFSSWGIYTATQDVKQAIDTINQGKSSDNALESFTDLLGLSKSLNDLNLSMLKFTDEYYKARLNVLKNVTPLTELYHGFALTGNENINQYTQQRAKLNKALAKAETISGSLGIGVSMLQLMQAARQLHQHSQQNDDHLIRADIAKLVNQSAQTLGAMAQMAKTLQGTESVAMKQAKKKAVSSAADQFAAAAARTASKATTSEVEKRVGLRAIGAFAGERLALLAVPYLGEILLAIDIATSLYAAYEEANRDNRYQAWVKLSNLSKQG